MQDNPEAEAYKRLLQIAQQIIYSMQSDENIVEKYELLKNAVLNKLPQECKLLQSQQSFYKKLQASYKTLVSHTLHVISQFQSEIQAEMDRDSYNGKVISITKQIQKGISQLSNAWSEYHASNQQTAKVKLLLKQQLATFKYFYQQLDNKFENMGLMIEVHKKMHEIICQASKNEVQKIQKEEQYQHQIYIMEKEKQAFVEAKSFIQECKMAQEDYRKFKVLTKKMEQVLFQK